MPFAPPHTWVTPEIVDAADIIASNNGLREYLEKLPDNAWNAGKLVDTQHIMRGQYLGTINQAHFVSGIWQGKVFHFSANDSTYATVFNTGKLSTNASVVVPLTAHTLEIRHNATVFYQWVLHPIGRYNDDLDHTGLAGFYPFKGNPSLGQASKVGRSIEENTVLVDWPQAETRFNVAGHMLFGDTTPAVTSVGMLAKVTGTMAKSLIFAWSTSVETFYI